MIPNIFPRRAHSEYLLRQTCVLLIGVCLTTGLFGQRAIEGTVVDAANDEPLIGANVVVKDTLVGTITDLDGRFTLNVPDGFNRILISYTGYQAMELTLTDQSVYEIRLQGGQLLEEIIVIGYGTIEREDATGSLQSVSSEDFNRGAITGAQELLAGKVPGVTITTDGSPGSGSAIRIRGESSLSATNDPLIVIDGVPIDNSAVSGSRNALNVLNPNDIETFTVLKDASASAIYGNRAAGGVILITTKKGKVGDGLKVGYSANVSFGRASGKVDVLSADDYRAQIAEQYEPDHPAHDLVGEASTDWQDEIYETAFGHDHNVYVSGGFKNIPYRVSLGYTDKDGILMTDNFKRITTGINLNPGFLDNTLQVNLHLKGMFTNNQFADRGAIGNAVGFDPTHSPYDPDSEYGGFFTWTAPNGNPQLIAPTNPLALLMLRDDQSDVTRYIANIGVDYRLPFLPALRANLSLATDHSEGEGTVVVPTTASFAFDAINGGGVNNIYSQTRNNDLLEFYLNYKETFGEIDLDVMGGYSWQHFEVDNSFTNSDAAGTPAETTSGSDPAEYYLLSMYGRVNVGYQDKYLLTATLRRDGTSRFAPDNRWGLFPAAALAVKLIDNDRNTFDNVKLRLGWGITGQQDIGDFYAYLARYQLSNENARYQFGNEFVTTLRPNGYDANIQWEETETYNIGVDFSIIRDRLYGSVDVYKRLTKDLLNRIPVPAGTNLTNFVTTNVGNMENEGIELSLFTTPVSSGRTTVEFGVNMAYNRNEITKLTAIDDPDYEGILTGGIAGGVGSTIQIHSVGFAPRSFYVLQQLYDENGNILED
ncbi:MAG: SusC/RagA family TonB-linked outer membrane protein, partial [Saprospiraceae bacterium]|nr:SusC/RagA family TonB-linked outer membrane protein [Saprospiraceae bacterium]